MPIDYTAAKEKLYSAVIADILDEMGYREQVLDAAIRPLQLDSLVVGRARTVLAVPEFTIPAKPFDQQIAATDALEPGDSLVAHMSQLTACAFWGELFSTGAATLASALARSCTQPRTNSGNFKPKFATCPRPAPAQFSGGAVTRGCGGECRCRRLCA